MSLLALRNTVVDLPRSIADQVLGYAESVERELPNIFENAGKQFDHTLADELVFVAGVRKLHAIVASSYWTLDNSATLLAGISVDNIRVGELDYSRGGELYKPSQRALTHWRTYLTRRTCRNTSTFRYPKY